MGLIAIKKTAPQKKLTDCDLFISPRHCEPRSGEAIRKCTVVILWIASPLRGSQ
jgi:hypothetical protein